MSPKTSASNYDYHGIERIQALCQGGETCSPSLDGVKTKSPSPNPPPTPPHLPPPLQPLHLLILLILLLILLHSSLFPRSRRSTIPFG